MKEKETVNFLDRYRDNTHDLTNNNIKQLQPLQSNDNNETKDEHIHNVSKLSEPDLHPFIC